MKQERPANPAPTRGKSSRQRRVASDRKAPASSPARFSGRATAQRDILKKADIIQLAQTALLDQFAPPFVVIDQRLHLLFFHGRIGRYLELAPGGPKRPLPSLLREPLRSKVGAFLKKSVAQKIPASGFSQVFAFSDAPHGVAISLTALSPRPDSPCFLVTFVERSEPVPRPLSDRVPADELRQMRDELHSRIGQLRTNNDEMRAAHEETVSMNEALQCSNTELETSKRDLQALNKEMTVINARLHAKMEELEGSTNDMSSLLSSTNIAVVFLDLNLRIRRYTPAVNDLVELFPSIIGRHLHDVTLKVDDPSLTRDIQRVFANHVPMETEVGNGTGPTYIRRVLPYHTVDNRLNGIVVTFVDITQRKLAEMALRTNETQYRLILEGIKEYAIFLLDRDGRFASWAAGAERILGFSEAEMLGQHLHAILAAEDRATGIAEKELNEAVKKNTALVERWHVRKDGSKFWGTGTLSALYDETGRPYGFVMVVRDNTDRKFFEEALKQAKRYAENANASKDYFLANVSHELRTPLATIMLWSKLLSAQGTVDPAFLKEGLEAIGKSAKEQQALIDDLTDTSKIVAGKLRLEFKEMDLNQLIHDAMAAIQLTATEKGLVLDESLDPTVGIVQADPRRLRQVLMNVLNNAVKFTPAGGRISIKNERMGAIVEIHVTDTGKGISQESIGRVFDRYMQVEPNTIPTSGGMGLGLAIARQLVESHGGTIQAHSDGVGKGTVFTVRIHLPRIHQPATTTEDLPAPCPTLNGLRILLVEDAPATRKALTTVLNRAGAEVTDVDAAESALSSFDRQIPHLILSDIGLGKISGHDLIREIRARENERKIAMVPAVALTAYADEKNRLKALECGFQECLTKPVDPVFLVTTLASLHPDH